MNQVFFFQVYMKQKKYHGNRDKKKEEERNGEETLGIFTIEGGRKPLS